MEIITPLVEVKRKALETALHYVIYKGYKESETKALAALKRRCSGRTKAECLEWLRRGEMLFRDCIEFLEQNEVAAFKVYSEDKRDLALLSIAVQIKERYSEFPEEQLGWVLNLIFLNYHLR